MASRERRLTHEKKFSGPLYIPLWLFTQEMKGACREHSFCVSLCWHCLAFYGVVMCVWGGGGGEGEGGGGGGEGGASMLG